MSEQWAVADRTCFFADHGRCDGPMDRAHLIPKQRIKREAKTDPAVIWDERCWVPVCRLHHANFDNRSIRLPRWRVPVATEEFALEHGLGWSLDRDFGQRRQTCAVCLEPSNDRYCGACRDAGYQYPGGDAA